MALYFIDYDLKNERDYQKLYAALSSLGAKRFLKSSWYLSHIKTDCITIRDHLRNFIDKDDSLVVCLVNDWASCNAESKIPPP